MLRGAGRDAHFEYEVRLCVAGERYTLYRRYQRFRELQRYVRQRYGESAAASARLPPAKLFGRTSETLANERRGQLEVSTAPGCVGVETTATCGRVDCGVAVTAS